MYGVNYPSPFNELNYFDVTQAFPPDIMHNLLEGVIPLIIKLVLSWAHKEKHITIQELNDELQQLSIGQNDKKNKPVQLSERTLHKSGIVGSASQKWFLFRILPFLMAHRVPPNSKHWNVFLLCRDIVDIVIAPRVKRENLAMLDTLVFEFLTQLSDVFGDVVTPKCHFLTHYLRLTSIFGPLRLLWCMRFEAKHQHFKIVASSCRNFINIAKTLSERHQMKQCWEFSPPNILDEFEMVVGRSIETPLSSLPLDLQKILTDIHGNEDFDIQRVSNVTIDYVKYALKDVFIVDYVHAEEIPLLFQIKYILNVNTVWFLCGKFLILVSYDSHFHAYAAKVDFEWSVIKPGQEMDFQALDTYSADDKLFVILKNV